MKKMMVIPLLIMGLCLLLIGCGTSQQGKVGASLEISSDVEFGKEDYERIISPNNELGFMVLAEVEADENNNIFISPTSLLMALSMVYNGADGVTKDEIAKALQTEGIDVEELNKANASLMTKMNKDSDKLQLDIANSIWINEQFHFQDEFAKNNNDYFNAEIREIDIADKKSPDIINDWVKNATNGKIPEIIDFLEPDFVALLINAIYFKGSWTYEFDKKLTTDRPFHLEDGTTKDMPLMNLQEDLAYLENESFQAVTLPYGDEEMSMKIFLPKENSNLVEFTQTLTSENWAQWNTEFDKKEGTIFLPKFQLEYRVDLNAALKKLGMNSAFDEDATFTKMIKEEEPLWISKVIQNTFLDVNEEGTEAAAVTSIEMKTTSAPVDGPFYMEVNRPFFIAITDDETGTILFMGSISEPQQ